MCQGIVDAVSSLRLVVPGRIQRELPQQLTVLGHHPDVETVHQHDDALCPCGRVPRRCDCRRSGWRNVTLPLLSIRSLRTLTPAPTRIIGPDGLALSRASKATLGGLRSLAR